jgi:hypothetical protein
VLVTNVSADYFSISTSKIIPPDGTLEVSELAYVGDYTVRSDVNALYAAELITVGGAPAYFPLLLPVVPTVRAIKTGEFTWVEFYDDGTSALIDITDESSPTVTPGTGGPGAVPPFLLGDSSDPVIRRVSTEARPADSGSPGDYLALVDPGAWGNPADETSHMDFFWQIGDVADVEDESWTDVDGGIDFADGTICNVTQSGKFYRCLVSFTNAAGTASALSNAIGPVE